MQEQDTATQTIERFRVAGYGGVVQDDDGRWVRFDDVRDLALDLKVQQDTQAGDWLLARLDGQR